LHLHHKLQCNCPTHSTRHKAPGKLPPSRILTGKSSSSHFLFESATEFRFRRLRRMIPTRTSCCTQPEVATAECKEVATVECKQVATVECKEVMAECKVAAMENSSSRRQLLKARIRQLGLYGLP